MANDNEVVIDARLNPEGTRSGVADLFDQIDQMKHELENIGKEAADPVAFEDAGEQAGQAFTSAFTGALGGGFIGAALGSQEVLGGAMQLVTGLLEEQRTALEKTVGEYEKATAAIRKHYEAQKEAATGKGRPGDSLGDDRGLSSTMDKKTVDAVIELGAQEAGYAAAGTWTRTFEAFGANVRNFFEGDVSGKEEQGHLFAAGKGVAERQHGIDENDRREDERRTFQIKADENRWNENNKHAEEYFRQQHALDEQEKQERESFDNARWREQNKEAEDYFKNSQRLSEEDKRHEEAQESLAAQERMNELHKPKRATPDFHSMTIGFEHIYSRIASAAGTGEHDKEEKAFQQRLKLWEESKKLREEQHAKAMEKQDKIITTLESKLGLG